MFDVAEKVLQIRQTPSHMPPSWRLEFPAFLQSHVTHPGQWNKTDCGVSLPSRGRGKLPWLVHRRSWAVNWMLCVGMAEPQIKRSWIAGWSRKDGWLGESSHMRWVSYRQEITFLCWTSDIFQLFVISASTSLCRLIHLRHRVKIGDWPKSNRQKSRQGSSLWRVHTPCYGVLDLTLSSGLLSIISGRERVREDWILVMRTLAVCLIIQARAYVGIAWHRWWWR